MEEESRSASRDTWEQLGLLTMTALSEYFLLCPGNLDVSATATAAPPGTPRIVLLGQCAASEQNE